MHTTTAPSPRSMPLVTSRMATPPPSPMLDLLVDDTVVGWIDGMSIGLRGFGDESEAVHAAWVAHRTLSRRFARESGRRPLPIDAESMSLGRSGDVELILAGGRPIATLVRPGADSRSGPESFGFELQVPVPANELTMRSAAYLVYRTLRRSGMRWAMWAPAPAASPAPPRRDSAEPAAPRQPDAAVGMLGTALVILVMLVVVTLPAITAATVVQLLGGVAALVALAALAGLVRLVVTDVRDSFRQRARPARPAPLTGPRGRTASAGSWRRARATT